TPERRQRIEASGRETEKCRARGDRGSSQSAQAMGLVSIDRHGRSSPGQAYRREAGGAALAAETSPSIRTLDRGARGGARDGQRVGQDRARERIDLYPYRRHSPVGESW